MIFIDKPLHIFLEGTHVNVVNSITRRIIDFFAERSWIRPQRSNPEQLGQKWTQYSSWIWIVIKYFTYYRFLNKCQRTWNWLYELNLYSINYINISCCCAIHCAVAQCIVNLLSDYKQIKFNNFSMFYQKFIKNN